MVRDTITVRRASSPFASEMHRGFTRLLDFRLVFIESNVFTGVCLFKGGGVTKGVSTRPSDKAHGRGWVLTPKLPIP